MEMNEQSTGRGFLLGIIVGAVVGGAVALLFAPKSGMETRALIKEKAEEATEKVKETADKAREAAINAEKKLTEKFRPKTAEE